MNANERFILRTRRDGHCFIEHEALDLDALVWQTEDIYGPFESREDARQFMRNREDPDILATARQHDPNDSRFQ